jgi:hypothetical protein
MVIESKGVKQAGGIALMEKMRNSFKLWNKKKYG